MFDRMYEKQEFAFFITKDLTSAKYIYIYNIGEFSRENLHLI